MKPKPGKRKPIVENISSSLFTSPGAQPYKQGLSQSIAKEQLPLAFAVDKIIVLRRWLLLVLITPTFLWVSLVTRGVAGGVISAFSLFVSIWLIIRYGSYLKGLFRIFDSVLLGENGVELCLLGKRISLNWPQIENVNIGVNFWDGIYYSIKLSDRSEIRFTDKIKYHLDLYNQITKRIKR